LSNPNDNAAWHLETAGDLRRRHQRRYESDVGIHGIDRVPGKSITHYVSSTEVGEIANAQTAIPSEAMEVITRRSRCRHTAKLIWG
jgi:hypothetical protein